MPQRFECFQEKSKRPTVQCQHEELTSFHQWSDFYINRRDKQMRAKDWNPDCCNRLARYKIDGTPLCVQHTGVKVVEMMNNGDIDFVHRFKAGDRVVHISRRKRWVGTIDETYGSRCTVVWDETGCATDNVRMGKLEKHNER